MDRRRLLLGGGATAVLAGAGVGGDWIRRRRAIPEVFNRDETERVYGDIRLRQGDGDGPDVVFISIDDLNDWVGFLDGHPGTITPNLDALAAQSVAFTSAHCSSPACLPSRTSVLFGRRPDRTGVLGHDPTSRSRAKELDTSPSVVDALWAGGYETIGAGKVFHGQQRRRWNSYRPTPFYTPNYSRSGGGTWDPDWTSPYDGRAVDDAIGFGEATHIDFGPSDPDEHPDALAAAWIGQQFSGGTTRPRLFALGIVQPHLPWRVPQRFLDLHPLDDVVVPEIRPEDLDDLGTAAQRLIDPQDMWATLDQSGVFAAAVQAYLAAVSFSDELVGRVLNDLADSPGGDEAVVVLWSDHGYHMGEKLHLRKFTLWERSTRVPLLVKAPGRLGSGRVEAPVSLLDLAPTLTDLADVEPVVEPDGESLIDVTAEPGTAAERPPLTFWRDHASVRTAEYRLIRYSNGEAELYDRRSDPDEFDNLSDDPAMAGVVADLARHLPDS